jgi:hypothetical protein
MAALVEGKISRDVYERWNRGAGRKELPERVGRKKKGRKKKRRAKAGRKSRRSRRKGL